MGMRATFTFVKAYSDVSYLNASASDYRIVPESLDKSLFETVTLSEAVIFVFTKNLSDSIVSSDITLLNISKSLLGDSFGFSDILTNVIHYRRSISDAFTLDDISQVDKQIDANKTNIATLSEVLGFGLTKPLTDTTTISDVLAALVYKNFADSFSFSDSSTVASGKGVSDSYTFSDTQNYNLGKGLSDSYVFNDNLDYNLGKDAIDSFGFSDTSNFASGKNVSDSFNFSDVPSLESGKNVSDTYSFTDGQNYNLGKGVNDSFGYTDTQSFNHNRILTDAFTLDDASLVDKDYYGYKENIFSFNDTISIGRVHGRALGNMVLGSKQFN